MAHKWQPKQGSRTSGRFPGHDLEQDEALWLAFGPAGHGVAGHIAYRTLPFHLGVSCPSIVRRHSASLTFSGMIVA